MKTYIKHQIKTAPAQVRAIIPEFVSFCKWVWKEWCRFTYDNRYTSR